VFGVDNGQIVNRFFGHTNDVNSVVFLPGDRNILSASDDGTLRLWSLDTGAEIHRFDGHTQGVNQVGIVADGTGSTTGVALHNGYLYLAHPKTIERYKMTPGQLKPTGAPEIVVKDLPPDSPQHNDKGLTFDGKGSLYINVGAPSNACQQPDRRPGVKGVDPCPILEKHGGVWKFDENKPGQTQETGTRFATGLRQFPAITWHDGAAYIVMNNRDQLDVFWPSHFRELREGSGMQRLATCCGDDPIAADRSQDGGTESGTGEGIEENPLDLETANASDDRVRLFLLQVSRLFARSERHRQDIRILLPIQERCRQQCQNRPPRPIGLQRHSLADGDSPERPCLAAKPAPMRYILRQHRFQCLAAGILEQLAPVAIHFQDGQQFLRRGFLDRPRRHLVWPGQSEPVEAVWPQGQQVGILPYCWKGNSAKHLDRHCLLKLLQVQLHILHKT
jgi:hypothetical protein